MPVSKSKRKNGRVKKSGPSYHLKVTPELTDVFRRVYLNAQLAVEWKLPKGNAEWFDMKVLSDMFNVATLGFINRTWLDSEELDDFEPTFKAAKSALYDVYDRGRATSHWACSGDELALIRSAIGTLGAYIEDSLTHSPRLFIKEFIATDILIEKLGNRGVMTKELVDWAMKQIENGNALKARIRAVKNRQRKEQ